MANKIADVQIADMRDDLDEVFAHLAVLEAALEVMYAMALAEAAPATSQRIKRGLLERMGRMTGTLTADPEEIARMQRHVRRSREVMERFVEKVARR